MNAKLLAAMIRFASSRYLRTQQVELKIDSSNRTLTVTAEETVTVEPDVAILHIGFDTPPSDAKTVYAEGAQISNAIIGAIKQAGVAKVAIRSESQSLPRFDLQVHKFLAAMDGEDDARTRRGDSRCGRHCRCDRKWGYRMERQGRRGAGAPGTGPRCGTGQRRRRRAAKGMGVRLGALIYVSNQLVSPGFQGRWPWPWQRARPGTALGHRTAQSQPSGQGLRGIRHRIGPTNIHRRLLVTQ